MNKKKSIISVLLLFFFIFTLHLFVYANDIQVYDLERLLAETQSKASYLSNSNIIIRDFIGYNVFSDKSTQLIEHEAIQIITEEGLKKFRDLTYYYDRYNQVLDIKIARYITPEGKIFDLAKDKITRKQVFEESSAFTNIFAVKMNFSDAPVGSIVEYCVVTNEKKLPLGNNFWCISYTQDTNPNMDSTFRVNFPQSYNINWITTKQKIEPVISSNNNFKEYLWTARDNPGIIREPACPPIADLSNQIIITTYKNWDDFSSDYWNAIRPSLNIPGSVIDRCRRLSINKNNREKALAVYNYIQKNFTFMDIGWGEFGFTPHSVDKIVNSKIVDNADMMALSLVFLNVMNIRAYPVLLSDKDFRKPISDIVYPKQFNHCAVVMEDEGKLILFDPSSVANAMGSVEVQFQGTSALVLKEGKAQWMDIPENKPYQNREEINSACVLEANSSITETVQIKECGANAQQFRNFLWNANDTMEKSVFEIMAKIISPDAKVKDGFITNLKELDEPLNFVFTFKSDSYASIDEKGNISLKLPVFTSKKITDIVREKPEERIYPVIIGAPSQIDKRIQLTFPYRVMPQSLISPLSIENEVGSYQLIYKFKNRNLWIYSRLIIKHSVIPVEKYDQLKKLIDASFQVEREIIYLNKAE